MRELVVTFDVEWAPDWIVESIANQLSAAGVRSTWFATHPSPLLQELAAEPLFEVGLHPNFLPNSTQGETPAHIMETMLNWFPNAKCVRTHSLFQSEKLLQSFAEDFAIDVDCSILLPRCEAVMPHTLAWTDIERTIVRVPHIFQDNVHMAFDRDWVLEDAEPKGDGLKVFDFHPLHILLNSRDMSSFRLLAGRKPFEKIQPADIEGLINDTTGVRDLFNVLVEKLADQSSDTISGVVRRWQSVSNETVNTEMC